MWSKTEIRRSVAERILPHPWEHCSQVRPGHGPGPHAVARPASGLKFRFKKLFPYKAVMSVLSQK